MTESINEQNHTTFQVQDLNKIGPFLNFILEMFHNFILATSDVIPVLWWDTLEYLIVR